MHGDEMDERIDAALRSYAEPPEGPESRVVLARVLARARAEKAPRRRGWAWLIPAAGCAAALAAAWLLRAPATPQIAWTPRAPGVVSIATAPGPVPERRNVRRAVPARQVQIAAERLPKLETFPAPAPLTPEEQKLVVFTRHGPAGTVHQVIEAQQHIDDPLEIAELKIQPLDEGGEQVQPKGKEK
jgi:hypothetical protein